MIFGYSDLWYHHWNDIIGVKFLFFVKEHIAEYVRVMIIMRLHYKQGNTDWDFDLGKQLTTMRESILFNEL